MKTPGTPQKPFQQRSARFNDFTFSRRAVASAKAETHLTRPTRFNALTLLTLLTLALSACTNPKPLHGGKATTVPTPTGLHQSISQGDNPSAPTKQTQTTVRTRTYALPSLPSFPSVQSGFNSASAKAVPVPRSQFTPLPSVNHPVSTLPRFNDSTPVLLSESEQTTASTEPGAAQKDTARELTAKLSSLKGVVWVGLGLFIFGLATIFWAPLRAIIGSLTTNIAITIGGLALMVLPTLIVGNELLILGSVAAIIGAWFLAHRHGHVQGELKHLRASSSTAHQPTNTPAANRERR